MRDSSVGIYLHIPFCERVCPYCDFAVVGSRSLAAEREDAYVAALERELGLEAASYADLALETVYFGGGTPSLLRPASIERILAAIGRHFALPASAEVTLEVNPSTLERARLPGFRDAGVNRLSIGIQSFDDVLLKRLGRAHRAEEGHATLEAARAAGFSNLSLDLIFAIPGQTRSAAQSDVAVAVAFGPEHVSAYTLTAEAGTPYALAVERGQFEPPDDDAAAAMMEDLGHRLAARGLPAYEISSYARPGFESRHNQRYWARKPVLGLGMGAWSTRPRESAAPYGARRANPRDLRTYLEGVEAGDRAEPRDWEILDPATARAETMFLGLRTSAGVSAQGFRAEFEAPPRHFYAAILDELQAAQLLAEAADGDLRLTARGRLLADEVAARFVGTGV